VFTKCGDETQIKRCLDTKAYLEKVLQKVAKLKIKKSTSNASQDYGNLLLENTAVII